MDKTRAEDLTLDQIKKMYADPNIKKYDLRDHKQRQEFIEDTKSPYRPKLSS